ncbi:MAG TPA: helix-turn-helix domain-containing protein [Roseiflexaceae bacterium]|nr:helix-turn-helix domain-containing protein [Roseiflexaceae bacterium]
MNGPTAERKYSDIFARQLTPPMLRQHAAGTVTYAATLHAGQLEQTRTRLGTIDIDAGGVAALRSALSVASSMGVTVWAVTSEHDLHQGGGVWCAFDGWYPAADVAALMQSIRLAAGLPEHTETWPRNQSIRLPLGLHRWTGRRGQLLLQTGELIDLDTPEGLADGLAALLALPENGAPPPAPPPPPKPEPRPLELRKVSPGEQAAEDLTAAQIAARFCAEHPLRELLERYGAEPTRDGYSCSCGVPHSHKTTLTLTEDGQRGYSLSPRCRLYNKQGFDSLNIYAHFEHAGDLRAAVRELARHYARQRPRRQPPQPDAPPAYQTEQDRQARAEARDHARADRRSEIARLRTAVQARAEVDALPPCARTALHALLECIPGLWGRPSVARLAEVAQCTERTIQRGLAELEQRGYLCTEEQRSACGTVYRGGKGTALRRLTLPEGGGVIAAAGPGVIGDAVAAAAITRMDQVPDPNESLIASERAPDAVPLEQAVLLDQLAPSAGLLDQVEQLDQPAAWYDPSGDLTPAELPPREWRRALRPSKVAELRAIAEFFSRPAAPVPPAEPAAQPGPPAAQLELDDPSASLATLAAAQLDQAAPAAAPAPPAAAPGLVHYRQRLAMMTDAQLRAEVAKQERTQAKHNGRFWAREIRTRLRLARDELEARAGQRAPLIAPRSPRAARSEAKALRLAPQVEIVQVALPMASAWTGRGYIGPTGDPADPQAVELVARLRELRRQWAERLGTNTS